MDRCVDCHLILAVEFFVLNFGLFLDRLDDLLRQLLMLLERPILLMLYLLVVLVHILIQSFAVVVVVVS
jgi:hypothetical protein